MKLIRVSSLVFVAVAAVAALSSAASAQQVYGSVGGVIAPGVYGRIDFGNAPPPVVIYQQPVMIIPPPPNVRMAPVYYNVPPGHAKKWRKHCREYNACGVPVYFVKSPEYRGNQWRGYEYREGRGYGRDDDHDHDHGRGHGRREH
jgi:hypothetical protein